MVFGALKNEIGRTHAHHREKKHKQTKLSTQIHMCLQCHSILWHTKNQRDIFSRRETPF